AFEAVNALGVPHDAIDGWSRLDAHIPMLPWSEPFYFLDYPFVLAVPLLVRTRLKDFAYRGWIATIAVTLIYLCVPVVVAPKPVTGTGVLQTLMMWERRFNEPVTAFPAFHVIWAFIAAAAYRKRIAWIAAIAIAISCLTTGMHTIADVLFAAVVSIAVLNHRAIARFIVTRTERLANSWREYDLGVIRVMTHGIYAALGATFGVLLVATFTGGMTPAVVFVAAATILGAALWAQFIEGSPQLLRPYGYYGGLLGACIAIAFTPDPWRMLAAYAVAAPLVQAFGRLRCLVQGCCHGRRYEFGIRYTHPRSRVTRLSELANQPLHATQLYSILGSIVSLIVLVRLWIAGAPLQFIAGTSFILAGLVRFVEEHFRGEPQTKIVAGLRVYQWLAIASVIAGAAMMAIGNTPAPAPVAPDLRDVLIAMFTGIGTYIAYGVDFPRLNVRFSRLV
ncbi:MAG TPA: prolipoprotein diacylglyceryl transferase family protein, partial [Thermoanaerobaculia bacterium]|nr:prolipoprotein diacylglyceryl transferase family protein [Thermoanaerobaculia bacterium]